MKFFAIAALVAGLAFALDPGERAALDRITAEDARAAVTFLASDELAGRDTPSPGLEKAADFIGAQFKTAGLEPAGDNGTYFQTAPMQLITQRPGLHITLTWPGGHADLTGTNVRARAGQAFDAENQPVVALPADDIAGRIVIGDFAKFNGSVRALRAQKPAAILLIARRGPPGGSSPALERGASDAPTFVIVSQSAADALAPGREVRATIHLPAPEIRDVPLRNVAGILRGSNPALRGEYLILSAHYDHVGVKPGEGPGDRIYNGANDNASGTVTVIEIAKALAALPRRPDRSILFLTFFGEEKGLIGSSYYTRHPLVPLAATVAEINFEQIGRTDAQEGPRIRTFAFSAPTYSGIPAVMAEAAKDEDVSVYVHPDADSYFARSDNYPFAQAGVVDHTIGVAFEYSDYHGLADEASKLDYENMAKVDRAIAAGIERLANAAERPHWADIKETAPYREAAH
jgi:hypothetical protein